MYGVESLCLCVESWIVFLNHLLQNNPDCLLKMQVIQPCLRTTELESEGRIRRISNKFCSV